MFFTGCGCFYTIPMKETREKYTYCYSGKPSESFSYVNTNGYYSMEIIFTRNNGEKSINIDNCIFYDDGFFIYRYNPNTGEGMYGSYIICNDTIKAQYLFDPKTATAGIHEVWFKIIDENRILYLYSKAWTRITEADIKQFKEKNLYVVDTAQFIPLEKLPDTDKFWIKQHEFFWCDKNEYQEYMAKIKSEK